jgi:hypothetical protein
MLRQTVHAVLMLTSVSLFTAPAFMHGGQNEADLTSEEVARHALLQFDENWKDYTNEPNLGDPRWKLKMEVRVRLAQAGSAAFPLLEGGCPSRS